MSRTAYILQQPFPGTRSFAPAYEHVERLKFIIGNPHHRPLRDQDHTKRLILAAMRSFDPDKDFYVQTGGDPMGGMLFGACWLQLKGPVPVPVLSWTRDLDSEGYPIPKTGRYVPQSVDLGVAVDL